MTKKQEEAIADLEAAFKKCYKYNLTFVGMDNEIICVSNKAINEYCFDKLPTDYFYNAPADVHRKFCGDKQKTRIIKAKAYIDSGGW